MFNGVIHHKQVKGAAGKKKRRTFEYDGGWISGRCVRFLFVTVLSGQLE
jgi:hypothetical protein